MKGKPNKKPKKNQGLKPLLKRAIKETKAKSKRPASPKAKTALEKVTGTKPKIRIKVRPLGGPNSRSIVEEVPPGDPFAKTAATPSTGKGEAAPTARKRPATGAAKTSTAATATKTSSGSRKAAAKTDRDGFQYTEPTPEQSQQIKEELAADDLVNRTLDADLDESERENQLPKMPWAQSELGEECRCGHSSAEHGKTAADVLRRFTACLVEGCSCELFSPAALEDEQSSDPTIPAVGTLNLDGPGPNEEDPADPFLPGKISGGS